MKTSRIVIFEGDAFQSGAVECACLEDDTVYIYAAGQEFEYSFDDEKQAQSRHSAFIDAWRKAIDCYETQQDPV